MGGKFQAVFGAVAQTMAQTPRSSALVEHLNSRLRNYFTLHRQLGSSYLALFQSFLNHRRFLRSRRPERIGKSPAQLMTGQDHPHWLTLLVWAQFSRSEPDQWEVVNLPEPHPAFLKPHF